MAGSNLHCLTALAAAVSARAGGSLHVLTFNDYLARGIVSIAFTLAPQAVILGTIPVAMGEALCFAPLRERVRALVWPQVGDRLQILPASLGEDLPYFAGLAVTF